MRRLLLIALLALLAVSTPMHAQTPDCTPQLVESLLWGASGQAIVPLSTDTTGFVPAGEVWRVRAAGIARIVPPSTTNPLPLEWMLQIDHKVVSQGNACCWLIPLMKGHSLTAATPTLALEREVLLTAGERLSARAQTMPVGEQMGLMFIGWKFPAACTSALVLGVGSTTTVAGSPAPPPDFSAMVTAVVALQDAVSALQAAIPQ